MIDFLSIVLSIFGVLQIILFFKIWITKRVEKLNLQLDIEGTDSFKKNKLNI